MQPGESGGPPTNGGFGGRAPRSKMSQGGWEGKPTWDQADYQLPLSSAPNSLLSRCSSCACTTFTSSSVRVRFGDWYIRL